MRRKAQPAGHPAVELIETLGLLFARYGQSSDGTSYGAGRADASPRF